MSRSSAAKISPEEGIAIHQDELLPSTLNEKEVERQRLQAEIDAFISDGGTIRKIPANVLADPPKKPESNYGGQPI